MDLRSMCVLCVGFWNSDMCALLMKSFIFALARLLLQLIDTVNLKTRDF